MALALMMWASVTAAAGPSPDPPESRGADPAGGARLLDVPYLPQTVDLCGGAALAMTLRYWGEREVYPEDFAALVDHSASGIPTAVLAAEVRRRGWQAFAVSATEGESEAWLRQQVDRGRPVIALIEVGPNRYHYVVIVAWTGAQVIAHDPARTPFRAISRADFVDAWSAAGRWALLVMPPADRPPAPLPSPVPDDSHRDIDACGALANEMATLARSGDLDGADAGLAAAIGLCSRSAAALRALAGVRFRQSRWDEASLWAERAARLDPDDAQGWDLLATSRFLDDEPEAALEAWNLIGRPSVDIVRVEGAARTRHSVIAALVGLSPRTMLTADQLGRAARRLDELPSAVTTRLKYQPVAGGLAELEAVVVERAVVPRGVAPLAAVAARALLRREFKLDVATPTGSGELWSAAWRWSDDRPRLGLAVSRPGVAWLPGIATVSGSWERSSYALPGTSPAGAIDVASDERRRAAVSVADWATSRVRWQAGAALDRWANDSHFSLDAAVDWRVAADRLSIGADTAAWVPIGSGGQFARAGVASSWRSTRDYASPLWTISAGMTATSAAAPFDLWPGAGTGLVRGPLLRAHPLLVAGIVRGPAFGRVLAHGTVEYHYPLITAKWGALRAAAFTDTARAWSRAGGLSPSGNTDVGLGIRLVLPGNAGTIRADAARGLRDGRVVVSSGWQAPWPGR